MGAEQQEIVVDADEVVRRLGITRRRLTDYVNDGLPCMGAGKVRTFIWLDVLAWYIDYKIRTDRRSGSSGDSSPGQPEDLKGSEARRASYMADLKKIELERVRGELVPMADVTRVLQDVATGLKTEILGLPTRIVGPVLGKRDRNDLYAYLTGEAEQLCTRLSQLRFDPKPTPEADDDEAED